jgi:hypothetical protein
LRFPKSIKDVENIEKQLNERRVNPNSYWYVTTRMKLAIANRGDNEEAEIARLVREIR